MRFLLVTADSMTLTALWGTAPCSLVEVGWRFRGAYCVNYQGDDAGSRHLGNVGCFDESEREISKKADILNGYFYYAFIF
jgi:hypothetical protein